MAVPSAPTIASIVTEGLKRAGRTSPTATQISDATTHQFREVKADIMLKAPTHPLLQATATAPTQRGQQRYALPTDANEPVSLVLLYGPTNWTGTATAGAAGTITLPAAISEDELSLLGKHILITDGTGEGQYRGCVGWNNTTKVWSTDVTWTTTPDATSVFQIMSQTRSLWTSVDTALVFDRLSTPYGLGTPQISARYSDEFVLYPIPDLSTYGLLYRYFVDLDQLDEAGTLFLNLLREWRSIWIQGIAVKTMQRYDEDRYLSELGVYEAMLTHLESQTARVLGGAFKDL